MDETQKDEGGSRGRGLFGMRRGDVERALNERDLLVRETQARLRAAEERIADLERELDAKRDHPVVPPIAPPVAPPPVTSIAASFVHDELKSILLAAEQAARRIVERAEAEAVEEVAAARDAWDQLQQQVRRYEAWRSRAEPVITAAQERVGAAQERSLDASDRIRESLRLLTESLGSVEEGLRDVMGLPSPSLEAPAVFDRGLRGPAGSNRGALSAPVAAAEEPA